MKNVVKSNFGEESNLALSILWVCGVLLIVYVLFIFRSDSTIKIVAAADKVNSTNTAVGAAKDSDPGLSVAPPDNEAYVFVNVNKKHFLTRFITNNNPVDTNSQGNKTIKQAVTAPVERVTKIIKSKNNKEHTDFNIKPVSGI